MESKPKEEELVNQCDVFRCTNIAQMACHDHGEVLCGKHCMMLHPG
jgi:hypothetical protein